MRNCVCEQQMQFLFLWNCILRRLVREGSRILEKSIDDLIVKKENGTVKQKSEDGKKSAWTVTVRNEKKAFDKKAGGERDNVNYFTVCMASKNSMVRCAAE